MNCSSPSLLATEIGGAFLGITGALKCVAELIQNISKAPTHVENQNANEDPIEAVSCSMKPAESKQGLMNTLRGSTRNSKLTRS